MKRRDPPLLNADRAPDLHRRGPGVARLLVRLCSVTSIKVRWRQRHPPSRSVSRRLAI
jgi:hypothetical protein